MGEDRASQPLTIKAGDLECAVIDNSESGKHRFGYNGIASMTHSACSENLFVPTYAGVNFEFLFDGTRANMEPRWSEDLEKQRTQTPSEVKFSGQNRATVHTPMTSDWGIEAWVAYQIIAPHYVDITVRVQPHKTSFQRGYIGMFFASYILAPEKRELQFWGRSKGETEGRWLETALPEEQTRTSYRFVNELPELLQDPFFFGGTSGMRFEKPVMYGRYRNMALAFFFDRGEGLCLAYCRDGGGEKNPAWDFAFLIPGYRQRRIFTRSLRLMYKPFVSGEDVKAEYEQWAASLNR